MVVTGGAGFIGSHLVRRLASADGPSLTVLDSDSSEHRLGGRLAPDEIPLVRFVSGDVLDQPTVVESLHGATQLVHLAALNHTDDSFSAPHSFAAVNVLGTMNVLNAARLASVGSVVIVSSDHVYGPVEEDEPRTVREIDPRSPHAASKASADLFALSFARTYGLDVRIIRPSNVFGPWQGPDKAASRFITRLLRDQPVPLYGDGSDRRDWLSVADCVEAIIAVMAYGVGEQIYNLQSGDIVSNAELAEGLADVVGVGKDRITSVTDTRGPDGALNLDCSPLHGLGWRPRSDLARSLRDTVDWYRNKSGWWLPQCRSESAGGHPAQAAVDARRGALTRRPAGSVARDVDTGERDPG